MEKFTVLDAVAAPLHLANINTDIILPARFLKTIARSGLGEAAFHGLRYDEVGAERADFILNRPGYRQARIVVAGENFGCGSSREHAPWALADFGIRCVIAPSFADIFYLNCSKNGVLCAVVSAEQAAAMAALADPDGSGPVRLVVDLERQEISLPDGTLVPFAIDPAIREKLLGGLDDIEETLQHRAEIAAFEAARAARQPWAERVLA